MGFVAEGVAVLPGVKTDGRTPTGAATEWAATDMNLVRSALLDLRNNSASVINVKTYAGAYGDNSHDDTAAIQTALTAGAGGVVYFPAGTYLVDVNSVWLKVSSDTTICGDGPASIIKVAGSSGSYPCIFSSTGANQWTPTTNVRFQDIVIDQNSANNPFDIDDDLLAHTAAPIYFNYIDGLHVERVTFKASGVQIVSAIGYGNVKNVTVKNNVFIFTHQEVTTDTDYDNSAIYIDGEDFRVEGNTFIDAEMKWSRGAIEVHGGPGTVTGNLSIGYRDGCNISRTETADLMDVVVTGNTFSKCGSGVNLQPLFNTTDLTNNITITGNLISINNVDRYHGSLGQGYLYPVGVNFVRGASVTGAFENITISGNTIVAQPTNNASVDADSGGVSVRCYGSVKRLSITGNIIRGFPTNGIRFYPESPATARAVDIRNNLIVDCGNDTGKNNGERNAIYAYGTLTDFNIEGNSIVDTAGSFSGYGGIVIPAGGTWTRVNVRRNHVGASFTNDIPATVNTDLVAHADVASDITLPNLATDYNTLLGHLRAAGVILT